MESHCEEGAHLSLYVDLGQNTKHPRRPAVRQFPPSVEIRGRSVDGQERGEGRDFLVLMSLQGRCQESQQAGTSH